MKLTNVRFSQWNKKNKNCEHPYEANTSESLKLFKHDGNIQFGRRALGKLENVSKHILQVKNNILEMDG